MVLSPKWGFIWQRISGEFGIALRKLNMEMTYKFNHPGCIYLAKITICKLSFCKPSLLFANFLFVDLLFETYYVYITQKQAKVVLYNIVYLNKIIFSIKRNTNLEKIILKSFEASSKVLSLLYNFEMI